MKCSKSGEYYGSNNKTIQLDGIVLNNANYLHDYVDWHYHENPYFTFILKGSVLEGNKKAVHECGAGTLLFHHWQDAHYNIGSKECTRGFHVEIKQSWFKRMDIVGNITEGSICISDPRIKTRMYQLFGETANNNSATQLAVDALLTDIFTTIAEEESQSGKRPAWWNTIRDILNEASDQYQLTDLAAVAGVHPAHLSRQFAKYAHTTIGDYIREVKIQQAIALMANRERSLTDIALQCGFADQSHFIRVFKYHHQVTPLQYRKLLLKS